MAVTALSLTGATMTLKFYVLAFLTMQVSMLLHLVAKARRMDVDTL